MRANQFIKELAYPGNIGMMELIKFQKVATPEEKVRMKLLLSTDKKAAWNLLQQVTGTELHEEIITEIDMSPSNLRKLAADTGAVAGMEFEMVVTDVENIDDEQVMEPDFDSDDRVSSFQGIEDFFIADGEWNSRREVQRLIERITEDYYEWAGEIRSQLWQDERTEFFRNEMENEFDFAEAREQAAEELELDPDSDEVSERVSEMFDEFVEEQWDNGGKLYQKAEEAWLEDTDLPDESDFFRNRGWRWMQDIYSEYSDIVTWPYYIQIEDEDNLDFESIANNYSEVVSKPVNFSRKYHGGLREPNKYVVEPDSSISADDGGSGLEFVSPPLPLDEMLSDLNKTIAWAKDNNYYTNQSTGLHMNVSIPGANMNRLDYVKLALLLGDQYILQQFGRESNSYTKSAVEKIKDEIKNNPESAGELLSQMRNGLNSIAGNLIRTEGFGKYTSINPKNGYIEFRSAGGDWLNEDLSKLENTLLRYVVALDAALDPEKYRQEYLKKLYQLLQPKSQTDITSYFAQYAAGVLPKAALKSFVRNVQTQRQYQKDVAANKPTGKMWWQVNFGNYSIEVVASSEQEAFEKAGKEYGLPKETMDAIVSRGKATAKPVRPYEQSQEKLFTVRPTARPGSEIMVRAASQEDAYRAAQETRPDIFGNLTMRDITIRQG